MDEKEITLQKGDENTPAIQTLNKSRQRAIYYRPVVWNGETQWAPTQWLPADPQSIAYYYSKGFRAKPPVEEAEIKEKAAGVILCPFCDFEPASPISLRSHLRKHITQTKEEKNENK